MGKTGLGDLLELSSNSFFLVSFNWTQLYWNPQRNCNAWKRKTGSFPSLCLGTNADVFGVMLNTGTEPLVFFSKVFTPSPPPSWFFLWTHDTTFLVPQLMSCLQFASNLPFVAEDLRSISMKHCSQWSVFIGGIKSSKKERNKSRCRSRCAWQAHGLAEYRKRSIHIPVNCLADAMQCGNLNWARSCDNGTN